MAEFEKTMRSRLHRLPQRGCYDQESVYGIIDEALVCHVSVVDDGLPRVIPMIHARIGNDLYLHGSRSSQLLQAIGRGGPTCIAFTMMDGVVFARSAFHHSVNYRSAVVFGKGREVENEEEKWAAFRALVNHAAPGRWDLSRKPNDKEAKGTLVVSVPLSEASAKIRSGPVSDDEADLTLSHWAGVVPLSLIAHAPIPAHDLAQGATPDDSIRSFMKRFSL